MTTLPIPLLNVERLCGGYGAAQILFDISLQVQRGEVVALLGRNGAGKSTLLKALMGLLPGRQGRVSFMGQDVSTWPPYRIAQQGLGFVPEDRRVFTDLSVMDNLEVGRQRPRLWPDGTPAPLWTPEKLFALFPNLGEMRQRLGGRMSGGEQQMLAVARTLMGNPLLVLLDEPSEGLAPLIVGQMAQAISALKAALRQRRGRPRLRAGAGPAAVCRHAGRTGAGRGCAAQLFRRLKAGTWRFGRPASTRQSARCC